MASTHNSTLRYIPIWSTFLPHILYTHLQSKCSLHIQNKYIYTEKRKKKTIWINNFIDKKTKNKKQALQNSNIVKETRHSRP